MGGQVFKTQGIHTARIPAAAALELADRIMPALRSLEQAAAKRATFSPARLVPSYRSKPDYGDLDIVVSRNFIDELGYDAIRAGLEHHLNLPVAMHRPHKNDHVLPLAVFTEDHGAFQIDLISAAEDQFDFRRRYLAWNDTGSYIGRVARQMGLRFGQDGLALVIAGSETKSVPVTTDMSAALEFLGYDDTVHRAGFDTREEIFDFIAAGRYFDPAIYEMDRMTNRARSRARKRPLYPAFIQEMRRRPAKYIWPVERSETLVAEWEAKIIAAFPGTRERRDQILEEHRRARDATAFFSGATATKLSGVTGKNLMHLMHAVQKEFASHEDFLAWKDRADEKDFAERLQRNAATLL